MSVVQFLKSKSFYKHAVMALVGLAIFLFAVFKWLQISTHHEQRIEVPNLLEMSLAEVELTLEELDLNWVIIDSASYNPSFPKKSVIEHEPEFGDFVKQNRKIYITLNPSGYRDITIPDLYGRTKRQATSELRAIGLRISEDEITVRDIGKDVVRGLIFNNRELSPGDVIPKNSLIKLKLGDGKGTRPYESPR